jgi:hypothetical protein
MDSTEDTTKIVNDTLNGGNNKMFWWKVVAKNSSGLGLASVPRKFFVKLPLGVKEIEGIPTVFNLSQNYPNPFNPSTTIRFGVPKESKVVVQIYNVLGQQVASLVDEVKSAGYYEVVWRSENLPSGVYIYRMTAVSTSNANDVFTEMKKMMLTK